MLQKRKNIIWSILASVTIVLGLVVTIYTPGFVMADAAKEACAGLKLTNPSAKCDDGSGLPSQDAENEFGGILKSIIDVLSWIVGVVAVIMVIIGGLRYIISGGDSNGVTGAKNTIMYALIGLTIVLFAQVIVAFVLTKTKTPPPADPTKKVQTYQNNTLYS